MIEMHKRSNENEQIKINSNQNKKNNNNKRRRAGFFAYCLICMIPGREAGVRYNTTYFFALSCKLAISVAIARAYAARRSVRATGVQIDGL